jgi:hypothetical protein
VQATVACQRQAWWRLACMSSTETILTPPHMPAMPSAGPASAEREDPPAGATSIVQLFSPDGESTGPALDLPLSSTPAQLASLVNAAVHLLPDRHACRACQNARGRPLRVGRDQHREGCRADIPATVHIPRPLCHALHCDAARPRRGDPHNRFFAMLDNACVRFWRHDRAYLEARHTNSRQNSGRTL